MNSVAKETELSGDTWRRIQRSFSLSNREIEVCRLIFDGHKVSAIARRLDIATSTVNTYVRRVYEKVNVNNRAALVMRLLAEGLGDGTAHP